MEVKQIPKFHNVVLAKRIEKNNDFQQNIEGIRTRKCDCQVRGVSISQQSPTMQIKINV